MQTNKKHKNWLGHPFLTLMRSCIKVGKWRSDSFRGEQTHLCYFIVNSGKVCLIIPLRFKSQWSSAMQEACSVFNIQHSAAWGMLLHHCNTPSCTETCTHEFLDENGIQLVDTSTLFGWPGPLCLVSLSICQETGEMTGHGVWECWRCSTVLRCLRKLPSA